MKGRGLSWNSAYISTKQMHVSKRSKAEVIQHIMNLVNLHNLKVEVDKEMLKLLKYNELLYMEYELRLQLGLKTSYLRQSA